MGVVICNFFFFFFGLFCCLFVILSFSFAFSFWIGIFSGFGGFWLLVFVFWFIIDFFDLLIQVNNNNRTLAKIFILLLGHFLGSPCLPSL